MMRLVQLKHIEHGRRIAVVQEPELQLIENFASVYDMAHAAIKNTKKMSTLINENLSGERLAYDPIYEGQSNWKVLPSFDHPEDPLKCMLAGTGLTHKASAINRQKMHEVTSEDELTDSMKMYMRGVESGHTKKGEIGVQPEWFYKGNGSVLKGYGDFLEIPSYGNDGGEEPEIAGIYINDTSGKPWRIGFTTANEFSDHVMERKNYLYLAPSKIRNCSIGPELVITDDFNDISGRVSVSRNNKVLWERTIRTGEANMCHSLANLEHHHFKYQNHCMPGLAHIYFFGADAFSFGDAISLEHGDLMEVYWEGMGRPLHNFLVFKKEKENLVSIGSLV